MRAPIRCWVVCSVLVACGGGSSPAGPACGPVTCGEGATCCDHCTGFCAPENSGVLCPDDTDPNHACDPQACGTTTCDVNTEVCVGTGPIGPSVDHGCEPIPDGCEHDRTCDCVSSSLCPAGTVACSDVTTNEIFCDNGSQ